MTPLFAQNSAVIDLDLEKRVRHYAMNSSREFGGRVSRRIVEAVMMGLHVQYVLLP